MSASNAALREALAKPHKYRAKPFVGDDGVRWDSRGEYKRWCDLQLLERSGEIRNLRRQVKIPLLAWDGRAETAAEFGRALVLDFAYDERGADGWAPVLEDFKGRQTTDWKIKRAILKINTGADIRISRAKLRGR